MLNNINSVIMELKIHKNAINTQKAIIEYNNILDEFKITFKMLYNEVLEVSSVNILNVLNQLNKEGYI